jgi:hypothetical protein
MKTIMFGAVTVAAVVAGMGAVMAGAAPIDGKAAKALLFAPVKAEVAVSPTVDLPKDQATALEMVGAQQLYYGAIAISPDEGLMSEATVAAANYHDTDAASAVALAECNAKKTGKSDCVVAALIRPEGWEARDLQLSSDATAAVKGLKGGTLAISAETGAWGVGADEASAVADCMAKNDKTKACIVVIAQ